MRAFKFTVKTVTYYVTVSKEFPSRDPLTPTNGLEITALEKVPFVSVKGSLDKLGMTRYFLFYWGRRKINATSASLLLTKVPSPQQLRNAPSLCRASSRGERSRGVKNLTERSQPGCGQILRLSSKKLVRHSPDRRKGP